MRSSAACWRSVVLGLAVALAAAAAGAEEPPTELTLPALMERMATTEGVVAHFRETREIGILAAPLESRGVLYFAPPERLARFTLDPGFSSLVIEGDSVRFREGREEDEIDLSDSPVARVFVENFIVLFNGDLERLQQLYETELTSEGTRWTLALSPRRAPLDRFLAGITLEGDEGGMKRMVVQDEDGDRTTTRFDEVEIDRAFAAGELEQLFARGLPLEPR